MARHLADALSSVVGLGRRLGRRVLVTLGSLGRRPVHHSEGTWPPVGLEDIFYLGLSPESPYYMDEHRRYRGVAMSVALFFRGMLAAARVPRSLAALPRTTCPVLFCASTYNQHVALRPVTHLVHEGVEVGLGTRQGRYVSDFRAHVLSLPSLVGLARYATRLDGRRRRAAQHQFAEFLLAQGYLRLCEEILRRLRPKVVVLANDHSMRPVVMRIACDRLGIRTAYLQHGSVASRFPPLRFSTSFLDGHDAARKYDRPASSRGVVFLSGMAKADSIRQWLAAGNRRLTGQVGVCVTRADATDDVSKFIEIFRGAYPDVVLMLRPHPQDDRPWHQIAAVDVSRGEPSFEFLKRVDAIISGSSGIVLEAVLSGIPAVQFGFEGTPDRDYYGFAKMGLASPAHTVSEACEALAKVARQGLSAGATKALAYYCSSVSSEFDGHVAKLIAGKISEAGKGRFDLSDWVKDERLEYLDAYRLRSVEEGGER